MDTPTPFTLRGNKFPEAIIPDYSNNFQPKMNTQICFVRNSVKLCTNTFVFRDEMKRYDLIKYSTYVLDLITME